MRSSPLGAFYVCRKRKKFAWKDFFKNRFHSPLLSGKSVSRKIAYLGVLTAFSVVANAFFEIKLGEIQFSLTIFVCALIGAIAGGGYGFVVCFLGDMIGFFLHPFGAYLPMLGVSVGLTALFSGVFLSFLVDTKGNEPTVCEPKKFFGKEIARKTWENLKAGFATFFVCGLSFLVCTVGITHTTFFFTYAVGRIGRISYTDFSCKVKFTTAFLITRCYF